MEGWEMESRKRWQKMNEGQGQGPDVKPYLAVSPALVRLELHSPLAQAKIHGMHVVHNTVG